MITVKLLGRRIGLQAKKSYSRELFFQVSDNVHFNNKDVTWWAFRPKLCNMIGMCGYIRVNLN